MPIYEFKCLKCQEYFELLVINNDDEAKLQCPKCKSKEYERILSTTNFATGNGAGENKGPAATTRTCSGGSCTTYDIPGPTR
ncbi:MAG: zinc ribbon domain-containing protein [Deltaproteobacteria bacterium]|nr:zinc ribbon domain-containing protein [Deltaproteobacteria bacterium]MBT8374553.1 zinc ribbon domain-containing protein [Deltaproteobacteria bacterium]NNL41224.1 zinc ribbon domain-containing protein [Desulfobacterales bacterium]